jgi:hypothetical protein
MDEVRQVLAELKRGGQVAAEIEAPSPAIAEAKPPAATPQAVPTKTPRGARYVPSQVKIRSESKEEALFKLFKDMDNVTHKDALRYLASRGDDAVSVEDLKAALKLPEKYKLGGFTAGIRRRAPAYGLEAEDVLIVEYKGIVAGNRILDYRLGPEMLSMMTARGLAMNGKEGKD